MRAFCARHLTVWWSAPEPSPRARACARQAAEQAVAAELAAAEEAKRAAADEAARALAAASEHLNAVQEEVARAEAMLAASDDTIGCLAKSGAAVDKLDVRHVQELCARLPKINGDFEKVQVRGPHRAQDSASATPQRARAPTKRYTGAWSSSLRRAVHTAGARGRLRRAHSRDARSA